MKFVQIFLDSVGMNWDNKGLLKRVVRERMDKRIDRVSVYRIWRFTAEKVLNFFSTLAILDNNVVVTCVYT